MRWYQWAIPLAIGATWEFYRMWRNAQRAPVVQVEADDPEMVEAIAKARATLPEFLGVLVDPQPGHRDFAIKALFPDLQEHIWVSDPTHAGREFVGRLANHPAASGKLHLGDEVHIPDDWVTDWKYIQHDVLIGGYGIRLLRKRMDEESRRDLDSRLDFRILD